MKLECMSQSKVQGLPSASSPRTKLLLLSKLRLLVLDPVLDSCAAAAAAAAVLMGLSARWRCWLMRATEDLRLPIRFESSPPGGVSPSGRGTRPAME